MGKKNSNGTSAILVVKTVIVSLSIYCWFLTVGSFLATQAWADKLLCIIQAKMVQIESAGNRVHHCPLCGMSRAFKSIWGGQFDQALAYNANSLWLFSLIIAGCFAGVFIVLNHIVKKRRRFCNSNA